MSRSDAIATLRRRLDYLLVLEEKEVQVRERSWRRAEIAALHQAIEALEALAAASEAAP